MRDEMIDRLELDGDCLRLRRSLADAIGEATLGGQLDDERRQRIVRAIAGRGVDFVVQEAVSLSTMPIWHNGKLEPRPFILRLFLTRAGDRWTVMPGGFVRIADNATRAPSACNAAAAPRTPGCCPKSRWRKRHAAADARAHRHPASGRRAAEPCRRQPVLGRPLRRARRGDAAAGAGAAPPR